MQKETWRFLTAVSYNGNEKKRHIYATAPNSCFGLLAETQASGVNQQWHNQALNLIA